MGHICPMHKNSNNSSNTTQVQTKPSLNDSTEPKYLIQLKKVHVVLQTQYSRQFINLIKKIEKFEFRTKETTRKSYDYIIIFTKKCLLILQLTTVCLY